MCVFLNDKYPAQLMGKRYSSMFISWQKKEKAEIKIAGYYGKKE